MKRFHATPIHIIVLLLTVCIVIPDTGCKRDQETAPARPSGETAGKVFADVTETAGITHRHHKPVLDHKLDNIMSWMCSVGAAAAAGDYNNDGWVDLYVTDSRKGTSNHLYRNNGDGTFTDVARAAGVADLNDEGGTSMDCVFGDYDNDGWIDLYVVRWGTDRFFRNNGDDTFTDVTRRCFPKRGGKAALSPLRGGKAALSPLRGGSPGTQWANGNAAIFFDYDLDGRLDLYVGNYFSEIDLWHLKTTRIMHDDFERARNGGRNFLYHQQKDGTFTDVAVSLGVDDPGWTLAVGSADINNDGWPDLYCADDFGPDQLFLNRGDGTFKNVSDEAIGFDSKKGMNVDFADFNNDGWLDIYVTNITTAEYLQEGNMLWHNNGLDAKGKLTLTDVSLETGTYDGGWGWGAKFFDYDNDGDLDIIALNGFISAGEGNYWYDLASWTVTGPDTADARNWPAIGNRSFSGYETTRLWRNDGLYSFSQRAKEVGLASTRDGRGVVVWDYDNDGDTDLYIANQNDRPHLYRNEAHTGHHWLIVALEADPATGVNRDAIGTRVTLVTSQGRQIRERNGGNGYACQSDPRLHFGLGSSERAQLLEVRWPDGGLQYLENVPADQIITVLQDPSRYAKRMAIAVTVPQPLKLSDDPNTHPSRPPIAPDDIDRILSQMEERLRERPAAFAPASLYRTRCVTYNRHDRSIQFFQKLVAEKPSDERARIELACAYIDKIPTCGGLAAIVSKGTLAKNALNQLDPVIEKHGDLWVAYYCRGMNHLHWPRALRHSDDAVADFMRCIELQKRMAPHDPPPYFARTHIGLGDALIKMKQYDLARQAWRDGLKRFPKSTELKERLAIADSNRLLKYVESVRSLEKPIDTGLSFLDRAK